VSMTLSDLKRQVDGALAAGVPGETVVIAVLHEDCSEQRRVTDAWANSREENEDWLDANADDVGIDWTPEGVFPTFNIAVQSEVDWTDGTAWEKPELGDWHEWESEGIVRFIRTEADDESSVALECRRKRHPDVPGGYWYRVTMYPPGRGDPERSLGYHHPLEEAQRVADEAWEAWSHEDDE